MSSNSHFLIAIFFLFVGTACSDANTTNELQELTNEILVPKFFYNQIKDKECHINASISEVFRIGRGNNIALTLNYS